MTSAAQAVLLYVFENILKILHPFMPYVTEALWQVVNFSINSGAHVLVLIPIRGPFWLDGFKMLCQTVTYI